MAPPNLREAKRCQNCVNKARDPEPYEPDIHCMRFGESIMRTHVCRDYGKRAIVNGRFSKVKKPVPNERVADCCRTCKHKSDKFDPCLPFITCNKHNETIFKENVCDDFEREELNEFVQLIQNMI